MQLKNKKILICGCLVDSMLPESILSKTLSKIMLFRGTFSLESVHKRPALAFAHTLAGAFHVHVPYLVHTKFLRCPKGWFGEQKK
jgi:hypothetical protein